MPIFREVKNSKNISEPKIMTSKKIRWYLVNLYFINTIFRNINLWVYDIEILETELVLFI